MILMGTCGFSYPEWQGVYYPPGLPRNQMLEFYAEQFPALEVDVTYYRTPGRAQAESMVRRAAGRLTFCIKAPGAVTHERKLTGEVTAPYHRYLEPFAEAGKLGAVLFQFPNSFRPADETWGYLVGVAEEFAGAPKVIEFRHREWDSPETDRRVAELGFSRAVVDQPDFKSLSESGRLPETPGGKTRAPEVAYVRFHGRNAKEWWKGDALARYTYHYSDAELQDWVEPIREVEGKAKTTFVFFNNHAHGAAPANAATLAAMLKVPLGRGGGKSQGDLFG